MFIFAWSALDQCLTSTWPTLDQCLTNTTCDWTRFGWRRSGRSHRQSGSAFGRRRTLRCWVAACAAGSPSGLGPCDTTHSPCRRCSCSSPGPRSPSGRLQATSRINNKWFHNRLRSFASGHAGKMAASYSRHLYTDRQLRDNIHVRNKGSWAFTVNLLRDEFRINIEIHFIILYFYKYCLWKELVKWSTC